MKRITLSITMILPVILLFASLTFGQILTERDKQEAVQIGLKAKGKFTGLLLSDTAKSWAAALATNQSESGGTGFSLTIYTPQTWIAQMASNAAKKYESFTVADITEDMLSPVLRVVVYPDTPTRITAAGMRDTSSVQHVVLRDEAKTLVVQPTYQRPFTTTTSSALRDVAYQGVEAAFPLRELHGLRGPNGNKEFLVVIVGDGNTERTFKIKKKHFERMPYSWTE